jgi:hypothetical protein
MAQPQTESKRGCLRIGVYAVLGLSLAAALLTISLGHTIKNLFQHTKTFAGFGAGVDTDVSEQDLGLAVYPGARPHKDDDDDDNDAAGANIWALAGGSGLKVAVKTFETDAPPEKVVAFYRTALAKYGPVLTCAEDTNVDVQTDGDEKSQRLTCEGDETGTDHTELKVGTKRNQHIVSIRKNVAGGGSIFSLIFVRVGQMD